MKKKIKCDIYIRVSTTMQVDGYSLDAQREKLKRYAEFQNMEIVNEYSDEGKSGKSVEGRPEFQRMLDNIENGTDEVQFVLVFKLSRFGRNAADVLNSLKRMQDFGVNLICVEDGIDSSKDSGKLMISVLSAVAEIERENNEQEQPDGRFLKHIKFCFPVYFGDRETQELCWDNESTIETVCLLGNRKPDTTVKLSVDMDDYCRIINGKDEE